MTIDALARCMQRAIDSSQIGTTVAVRVTAYISPDPDAIEPQLGEAVRLVSGWVGSPLLQVHVEGGLQAGEITALLRFEQGQTALISCGVCSKAPYTLGAVVFGTKGVISWEAGEHTSAWKPARHSASDDRSMPGMSTDAMPSQSGPRTMVSLPRGRSAAERLAQPSPVTPPYGVLLVAGDHTHQPQYAAAFANDARCRLIGITDEFEIEPARRQLNEQMATRLRIPYLDNLDQALARSDVQVVSICAEPARRGPIIVKAANAGKHLYLDKPLCGAMGDAAEIVEAVQAAGVLSHMFSQIRWEHAERAKQLVDSGRLGALVAVHTDLSFAKGHAAGVEPLAVRREDPHPRGFEFPDAKRELTNIGVYNLVLLLWLLKRNVTKVTATTGNYFFEEHKNRDVEDFGQVLLELDGGLIASVTAGRTGWLSHPLGGLSRICLLGTRGTAVIDADRPRAEVWADTTSWSAPPRDPDDPMGMWQSPNRPDTSGPKRTWFSDHEPACRTDVEYFLDCLERGRTSDVPADLAAAASEVLLAAYQSAAHGETIVFGDEP